MFNSVLLLFLVTILPATTEQAGDKCYCEIKSSLFFCPTAVPCGTPNAAGFVPCCVAGDVCGADGFCHFTHSQNGTSGYYLASCTDPTYRDSSCKMQCTGNPSQDVVYNVTSGLWACCYNGGGSTPDCSNPGSETFQADTPKNLFAAPFGSLITTSISTPAKTSTSSQSAPLLPSSPSNVSPSDPQTAIPLTPQPTNLSSTSNATSPDASSSSTNLTTSAKAGLSIGIIVAILAIAGLIYLFILRPRLQNEKSSKQHSAEVIEIGAGAPLVSNSKGYSKVATGSGSAAAGNGVIYELGLQDGAGANSGVVGYQQFNAKDGRAARSGLPGTREAGKENGNGISELG